MKNGMRLTLFASATLMSVGLSGSVQGQQADMSFFITSVGSGKGADLGGLAGADTHCQSLAQAAGAGNKTWRAYLSTTADAQGRAVNARDRVGPGPWKNAKGVVIAQNVEDLHSDNNKISKETGSARRANLSTPAVTGPTCTTFSPARRWTAARFRET
jgi:hypothetical protein